MNKETQSILVAMLGGLLLSITASGRFTAYVKPGFAPFLVVAGVLLIVVGLLTLILSIRDDARPDAAQRPDAQRPDSHDHDDEHGHDHDRSRAPWLILAPVLVLLLVAPPALGADSVARNAGSQAAPGMEAAGGDTPGLTDGGYERAEGGYKPNDGSGSAPTASASRRLMDFPALPDGERPVVPIRELILRALYDGTNSVSERAVTITGFIAPPGEGFTDGYTIARMVISCCAADASPMQVHVEGAAPFPTDTWVTAVVTAVPDTGTMDNGYVPTVMVESIEQISPPDVPYEL